MNAFAADAFEKGLLFGKSAGFKARPELMPELLQHRLLHRPLPERERQAIGWITVDQPFPQHEGLFF